MHSRKIHSAFISARFCIVISLISNLYADVCPIYYQNQNLKNKHIMHCTRELCHFGSAIVKRIRERLKTVEYYIPYILNI